MARKVKNLLSKPWNEGFRCFLPQTQATLQKDSFNALRKELRAYLAKRGLNFGPIEEVLHECVCAALDREKKSSRTHCTDAEPAMHPEEIERRKADVDPRGPHGLKRGMSGADGFAWRELHLAAADGRITKEWVNAFLNRMSCGNCKHHAQQFVRLNPPPIEKGVDEVFHWSWFWHDYVNSEAKNRRITLAEARHLYHLD